MDPARRRTRAARERAVLDLVDGTSGRASARLPDRDAIAFVARLEQVALDLYDALDALYGDEHDVDAVVEQLTGISLAAAASRPADLRDLDRRREIDPGWFQRARMVGYVCYVDRFCGRLADLPARLDYLAELGVSYLHLMPLLQARPGENDGGYAVVDYRAVEPRLGTMDELETVARALRARGISLCIDVVLNHTAREHEWARRFVAGDPAYADFYLAFPDRSMPDAYEATLPEVFPDTAPGSFTWEPAAKAWIWTTFHHYQWDLNYRNPRVFAAMLETVLFLANRGVDVLRLDAAPFTWKRLGTDCQNQPEAHRLLQALRALARIAAPAVVFKAEAIVAPDRLVQYLGAHDDRYVPECDLAYNNQLMVMSWSSLASKDAPLMTVSLDTLREPPPATGWVTYVRCHDDIGWAVSDEAAAAVGWNGFAHRRFLTDFYGGRLPYSFADGAVFQDNPGTGDARTSGMAAALCGLRWPDLKPAELEFAVRRLVLLYAIAFSYGGIPLIYMGDEIALGNDSTYLDHPDTRADNRWMHRPFMNWPAASRRSDPGTIEGRVFAWFRRLSAARRTLLALRAGGESRPLWTDNRHIFAYRRRHPRSKPFLALVNFNEHTESCAMDITGHAGLVAPETVLTSDEPAYVADGRVVLPPLSFAWYADQ